jgi:hypothetical protein
MARSQAGRATRATSRLPYELFWHAETHLSGGRAAVFNSSLELRDAKYVRLESGRADGRASCHERGRRRQRPSLGVNTACSVV